MRPLIIAATLAAFALPAAAEDNQAGVPLSRVEAPGSWTISAGGKDLCTLTLAADQTVKAPETCADVMLTRPTTWEPTRDGMRLLDVQGQPLVAFNRWSNSLFVAHRASGLDVQLRRGTPAG